MRNFTAGNNVGIFIINHFSSWKNIEKGFKGTVVRDRNVNLRLFTTYIRPHLEFTTPVWAPISIHDIRSIDNVQIQAVNISGLRSDVYNEKLKDLGLLSYTTKRTRYDLIETYKTLEVERDELWFKRVNQVSVRTTRQSDDRTRLTKQRTNTTIRSSFFTQKSLR